MQTYQKIKSSLEKKIRECEIKNRIISEHHLDSALDMSEYEQDI
jgi:DNA-binding GntR family transcriptional regulator